MPSASSTDTTKLIAASTIAHFDQARELMVELMTWDCSEVGKLGLDAALVETFYYSQRDLQLPGEYAPPEGLLILALDKGLPAGCGAFGRLDLGVCELKRLYVRDAYRGRGIGAQIVAKLVDQARRANYRLIRLETVTFMKSAIAMYRSMGFQECDPYYEIPEAFRVITVFMELEL